MCVCGSVPTGPGWRTSAAGVTWGKPTESTGWAARYGHTSVIDKTGAIYVIGGVSYDRGHVNDVYASTDGGARPDSVIGVVGGYSIKVALWAVSMEYYAMGYS